MSLAPLPSCSEYKEFKQRGVSFVKELSFIDQGPWGFEVSDADGHVVAFFQVGVV